MIEAAKWLRELSEPWASGERSKTAIERAAKLSGLHYWRAFDLWYGKARRISPQECEAIANAIESKNEKDIRDELAAVKNRIARLESLLVQGHPQVHSTSVDQAREMARHIGRTPRRSVARK